MTNKKYKFLQNIDNLTADDIPEMQKWLESNDINKPIDNEPGHTLLEYAVMSGSVEVADFLVNNGADMYHCTGEDWDSLIELAALVGNLDLIKYFLEKGFDKKAFLKDGSLISAAINNHVEIVKYLINQGKDINQHDCCNSMTALCMASQMQCAECVELLCDMGADIEAESEYGTPLFAAASSGDLKIVKILLKHGANVNYVTKDGSTPYEIAGYNGYEDVAEYLLKCGANSNLAFIKRGGKIPSVWYAYTHENDAYEASGGNDPTFCKGECQEDKVRYKNFKRENESVVNEWLKNHNICLPDNDCKLTWFEYAVLNDSTTEMIKFLLSIEISPYTSSSDEWNTIIEFAAMYGRLDIIKHLLENGYDKKVFLEDDSLIFAASNDFTDVIKYLIENEKEIDKPFGKRKGYTALREAAQINNLESAKLLCELGANVNSEGVDTPLYSACAEGNFEIVKLLIDNGANVNYKNKYGVTPYEIAKFANHTEIADYLLKHGDNPKI